MKTTAKYVLSLRRLAIESFDTTKGYHQITKELLKDFNVSEVSLNDVINDFSSERVSDLEEMVRNCNLVIDVMDFTKFRDDVAMWRRVITLFQRWADELKENSESPVEFKTADELQKTDY